MNSTDAISENSCQTWVAKYSAEHWQWFLLMSFSFMSHEGLNSDRQQHCDQNHYCSNCRPQVWLFWQIFFLLKIPIFLYIYLEHHIELLSIFTFRDIPFYLFILLCVWLLDNCALTVYICIFLSIILNEYLSNFFLKNRTFG